MDSRPNADNPPVEVLYREPPPEDRPASPQAARAAIGGLLEWILAAPGPARPPEASALEHFLEESQPWPALAAWLRLTDGPPAVATKAEVARVLSRDIARIDELLSRQVNAILHHKAWQALEASWRGLHYLVQTLPEGEDIKVRVLNVSWKEVVRDQKNALEFDQSHLFRKVYEEEFGHPGGEPFGVLLGDYEIRHRLGPEYPYDDIETLKKLSSVAAAAFAPLITGVHPSFFGLDHFAKLDRPLNLSRIFELFEFLPWRTLRQMDDARFLGLTLPRVLMRLPYSDDGSRVEEFRFHEEVKGPDLTRYLWGSSVYAFGSVLIRSFAESGWLAAIRGVQRGVSGGGLVTDLPVHSFGTERPGVAIKCSTDVVITDAQEKEFGDLGFIPLCHCHDTEFSAFYGNQSIQKAAKYDTPAATANARLSTMLQYILCVSRFAHYIKVICRDRIGALHGAADCEEFLRRWLMSYTTSSDNAGPEVKAKYPLREAKVQVRERPDKPGSYTCVVHLRPHYQLDQMITAMRVRTELAPGRPG
jgi:type VI secretion system ImpC/EvpB family protein